MSSFLVFANSMHIPLPNDLFDCVVTSPPYWNFRDYKTDGQLGNESLHDCLGWATGRMCLECYTCHILEVFRELHRVLKPTGSVWLNIGDGYAGGGRGGNPSQKSANWSPDYPKSIVPKGLKDKDLCGVPWHLAFALQYSGWWLRSEVIWWKPNQKPENVSDRPTRDFEQVFLLTKSANYYFDAEAVRVPYPKPLNRWGGEQLKANGRSLWDEELGQNTYRNRNMRPNSEGRNIRSVWEIPTTSTSDAHFATYPPKLVSTCLEASTSKKGVCPLCGKPWERILEHVEGDHNHSASLKQQLVSEGVQSGGTEKTTIGSGKQGYNVTIGWRPTCAHADLTPVPATVLDPFSGSGTTGAVAKSMGLNYIGIDLNPEYQEIARKKIGRQGFQFSMELE